MFEQEAMYEDVPSANLAQKNPFSSIIEKACIVERDTPGGPEQEAQHKMLQICRDATGQSDGQGWNSSIYHSPKQGLQGPERLPGSGSWGNPEEMAHDVHCCTVYP